MLKRLSSLVLVLVVVGSVLASTARLHDEQVCKMAGVEMMPGMETMPCCKQEQAKTVVSESNFPGQCCVSVPQEPGSTGTTFSLRSPSFSIALIHPTIVHSLITLPRPVERPYSTQLFLPNLQTSYIRNLSLLI